MSILSLVSYFCVVTATLIVMGNYRKLFGKPVETLKGIFGTQKIESENFRKIAEALIGGTLATIVLTLIAFVCFWPMSFTGTVINLLLATLYLRLFEIK